MVNLLHISWAGVNSAAPDQMPITIEPVAAHDQMPAYYRMELGGVSYTITDAHRRQIIDALASAPPLPKSDAQIDAEAEPLDPMEHQYSRAGMRADACGGI
jgi:hypothetical protein